MKISQYIAFFKHNFYSILFHVILVWLHLSIDILLFCRWNQYIMSNISLLKNGLEIVNLKKRRLEIARHLLIGYIMYLVLRFYQLAMSSNLDYHFSIAIFISLWYCSALSALLRCSTQLPLNYTVFSIFLEPFLGIYQLWFSEDNNKETWLNPSGSIDSSGS